MPAWVKLAVDLWLETATRTEGRLLRSLNRHGQITGSSLSPQAVLAVVRFYGKQLGLKLQPHDLRRTCAKLCRSSGGELEQIQLLLGHASIQDHRTLPRSQTGSPPRPQRPDWVALAGARR